MRKRLAIQLVVGMFVGAAALTAAPHGAIFTTLPDGSAVNYNIYSQKPDVYLDGGPGDNAPQHAAGLPDGIYVFQVTDPSGKVLLSVDPAGCRQFTVLNGVIVDTLPSGACAHATGIDQDHGAEGARTVQLCGGGVPPAGTPGNPSLCFKDTPNPGGEYKVWVELTEDYLLACPGTDAEALAAVDCTGGKTASNAHGFIPRHSKTDNFKVRGGILEIDTTFESVSGLFVDGIGVTWTDTLGASNNKYSYEDLAHDVHHEAHVEAVELGTHYITLWDQPGCLIGTVAVGPKGTNPVRLKKAGPQKVPVTISKTLKTDTVFIRVKCR